VAAQLVASQAVLSSTELVIYIWGVELVRLPTSSSSVSQLSRKCGIADISEPQWPPRPPAGVALYIANRSFWYRWTAGKSCLAVNNIAVKSPCYTAWRTLRYNLVQALITNEATGSAHVGRPRQATVCSHVELPRRIQRAVPQGPDCPELTRDIRPDATTPQLR
jgi:hypothetical protein